MSAHDSSFLRFPKIEPCFPLFIPPVPSLTTLNHLASLVRKDGDAFDLWSVRF